MPFINKKKIWLLSFVFIIGILFILVPNIRGPYNLQSVEIDGLKEVGEYKSEINNYSVKVFLKKGPTLHFEYSYVGALFEKNKFIRNIFWIGPSGNDFAVEWKESNIIDIKNLTSSNPNITLDVQKDKYDFRKDPFLQPKETLVEHDKFTKKRLD
ncbi:DUF5412 family protein [Gracilibacillus kekensis]|uniref:Uncharacterized protein n=1 Tax=Gracilibacillus kekensis TaxID=1027249 RepID=A0A1M7QWJ7_9BACI|nr:DUF5412 family protein [Gracilibacillus kekensis]SHN35966.1 hypothetical protein SAMN05216179_3662 [Gracilibacillus kekensis]